MNVYRPVGLFLLSVVPASVVGWAYRKEGVEQPHLHSEQAAPFDWTYDQRASIVSGTMVAVHHWAVTVTEQGTPSTGAH
jgi:hypothetical protein